MGINSVFNENLCTWEFIDTDGRDGNFLPGGTVGYPGQPGLIWRKRRLPSPSRINLFLCLSFCPSIRAKRGIWSKRVLIKKIGNFSFSVR